MALNKYMHPRNIYKSRKPDFKALATKYDYFKERVTVNDGGKTILDFKDPSALRVLTRALLEDDFGLVVTIPLDRLIPTVPQRLNYILWLEDMIGKDQSAKGIDIGTGSCCIYPLLGARLNRWEFLASEIDDQNILFANKNISNNKLEDKITVKKVSEEIILQGLLGDDDKCYDFCMCNPPFYSDHLEAQGINTSRNDDRSDASSMSTASEAESIAWGGEVRFVSQMIEESLILRNRVRLYTSLLGKKTSLSLLKDVLAKHKITNYSTTEFCQGRTMRWGIAWTFDDKIQFPKSLFKEKKNEKPPLTLELSRDSATVVGDYTVQAYTWYMWKQLEQLQIYFYIKHSGKFYSCFYMKCVTNTWSHQRRKKRQQKRKVSESCSMNPSADKTVQTPEKDKIENKESVNDDTKSSNMDTSNYAAGVEKNLTEVVDNEIVENASEKRKRECEVTETSAKKCKTETSSNENDGETSGNGAIYNDLNIETNGSEAIKPMEEEGSNELQNEIKGSKNVTMEDIGNIEHSKESEKSGAIDESNTLNRKDTIERFWKERETNASQSAGKKRMEKSFYECLEPFKEDEECLLQCKVVIKKEDGVISLIITHVAGNKEAMHQIMQYFKNKFIVQK